MIKRVHIEINTSLNTTPSALNTDFLRERNVLKAIKVSLDFTETGYDYLVDVNITDGIAKWADGTLYNQTEVAKIYPISGGTNSNHIFVLNKGNGLERKNKNTGAQVLCQANPFGRDW